MKIDRIFDLLENLRLNHNKPDILVAKREGNWVNFSSEDYVRNARDFAIGLMVMGFKKGDKIATVSNNRPEWNFVDMGMAHDRHIHFRDNQELVSQPKVEKLFQKEVDNYNKMLGRTEQINRFRLVCEPWSASSGELSPTLKLRRRVIYNKYAQILREIYSYSTDEENRGTIKFNDI
jgi:long-chain acyl-CoA synthetase